MDDIYKHIDEKSLSNKSFNNLDKLEILTYIL